MRRGRVARMTFIDKADNALTQIKRVRLRIVNHLLSEVNRYRLLKILLILSSEFGALDSRFRGNDSTADFDSVSRPRRKDPPRA